MQVTEGLVFVQLNDGNMGNHSVIGPSRRNYGYRRHGDRFYVLEADARSMITAGQVIEAPVLPAGKETPKEEPLPIFAQQADPDALLDLFGINREKLDVLIVNQHATLEYLAGVETETLAAELSTSTKVASRIINEAKQRLAA